MKLGMIGLECMGANTPQRLLRSGWSQALRQIWRAP